MSGTVHEVRVFPLDADPRGAAKAREAELMYGQRPDMQTADVYLIELQALMYYCNSEGHPTMNPADNPSGSEDAIAAVCNPSGNVMGSMPHVERFVTQQHDVNHRRSGVDPVPYGLVIMRSIVDYAAKV